MPASRPYFETDNEFDLAAANGMTKQLVFSSWRIAPKAIALGVSYAAEQDTHRLTTAPGLGSDEWGATAYRSRERTLLDLAVKPDGSADRETNFLLAAPFGGLAEAIDPASLGQNVDGSLRSIDEVRELAHAIIAERLAALGVEPTAGAVRSNDWYVYAARALSPGDDVWWGSVKFVRLRRGRRS